MHDQIKKKKKTWEIVIVVYTQDIIFFVQPSGIESSDPFLNTLKIRS